MTKMGKSPLTDQHAASGKHPENHILYAPALKWRRRATMGAVPYWIAPEQDVRAGYSPKSIMLDASEGHLAIAAECRKHWRDLEDWRAGKPKPVKLTIDWLIERYKTDKTSPFHRLRPDTQQSYIWECKRISETCGTLRLDPKIDCGLMVSRRTGEEFRTLFHGWGHPKGKDSTPSRATHCMAMLRALLSYNVEIGTKGAGQLRELLSAMRFEKPPARTKAPTYEQVDAIVNMAEQMGYRSIAITTLAQYELIERRTHILDGWAWEHVSKDWVIRYYQTKKGRTLREYDLKTVQRLLGLMQVTPKENRHGPIIICEASGEPWVKRHYQAKFREIARAAGVPDEIYSMDMRAGGATEADGVAGVSDRALQDAGGWQDPKMPQRYRRNKQNNAQNVVVLRQAARDKK